MRIIENGKTSISTWSIDSETFRHKLLFRLQNGLKKHQMIGVLYKQRDAE